MKIIMYDGQCLFCERWVKFVLKYAKTRSILFAPIQLSGLRDAHVLLNSELPSMVVIDTINNKIYFDALASLTIMRELRCGIGLIAGAVSLMPNFITNFVYRIIGKNRHAIFGRTEVCELPSSEERTFFVADSTELRSIFLKESVNINQLEIEIRRKYSQIKINK